MANNTRTNNGLTAKIVKACSFICAILLVGFMTSCGKKESPFAKDSTTKEVVFDENAELIKVDAGGIATVLMKSQYDRKAFAEKANYLWENKGPSGNRYGEAMKINLRGEAQAGDRVAVVRRIATHTLKTGEVYQECVAIFAEGRKKDGGGG